MAIGQQMAPYIHTSFLNFKREEFGTISKNIEHSAKLMQKISELENIRDQLKAEADSFLQGKTVNELFNEVYANDVKFVMIARQVIASKQFYDKLNLRLNTMNRNGADYEKIREIISNNVKENLNATEVTELLLTKIKKTSRVIDSKELEAFFKEYFADIKDDKEINQLLAKKLSSLNKTGALYKGLKKIVQRKYFNTNIGEVAYAVFEEEFNRLFEQKQFVEVKNHNNDSDKNIYLKQVKDNFIFYLSKKSATDISNLLGYGGEEIFTSVNQVGGKEIVIETIGSKTEIEIHKSDIPKNIYSLRKEKGQSYSDLSLTYKGKKVRIQSKNSQKVLENFDKKNSKALQQISLLKSESVLNFFERIKKVPNQLGIDLDEVAYVLANEAWFITAGNIRRENKIKYGPIEKMGLFQSYIDAALSNALINYLGVMLEDSVGAEDVKIELNNSNIFFLIDNKFLLPTYAIVDHLINNLKEWKSDIEGVYLKIDMKISSSKNARQLLEEKDLAIAPGRFITGGDYSDRRLLSAGMEQGREIMEQLRIKSINLNISLDTLMKSSYNLF